MKTPLCVAVLVVEDEPDIREALVAALDLEGYLVFQAENGARALELLKTIPHPSLVLADLMMPVMDGWQLIQAVTRDDRLATLPVVVVSAANVEVPGAFRRVKKPIVFEELLQIVAELCVRRS